MDFTLNEEQTRWRMIAREFAENVIKPDVMRRDRLPTAAERIPWDWIRQPEARVLGLLAKVNASETAFEACKLASEILGGAAIMYDHPVEKYLRDATSFLHSDGTNQICLLRAAEGLANEETK